MSRARWAVLALAALGACLKPNTLDCPGGGTCPANKMCIPSGGCALPEQLAACDGQGDGAQCTFAGTLGKCTGGVCVGSLCGNGVIDDGEVCDWGSPSSGGSQCRQDCLKLAVCGDGMLDAYAGEQCDDGNTAPGDGCSPTCKFEACGNGVLDPGEACDDGNNVSGDGCSADCRSNETCGNGYIDVVKGEECDDGSANSDAPDALCRTNCQLRRCGDGILDPATEYCDGSPPALLRCTDFGFDFGRLGCSSACSPDFTLCGFLGWQPVWTSSNIYLESVFGTGPKDIFAAGTTTDTNASVVVRFDGSTWTNQPVPNDDPSLSHLHSIWAAAPNDVWAGGDDGLFHYNGTAWTKSADSPPSPTSITGVWGFAANDVYAVGTAGTILHFDGTAWTSLVSPATLDLHAVWGSSPSDLWAAGDEAWFHYDGSSWNTTTLGRFQGVAIGGSGPDDVFIVDAFLELVYHAGTSGAATAASPMILPTGVCANGPDDAYVVGQAGSVSHYGDDDATWEPMTPGTTRDLNSVWASGPGNVFAVGFGAIVHGGVDWAQVTPLTGSRLHAMSGSTPGNMFGLTSDAFVRFDGVNTALLARGGIAYHPGLAVAYPSIFAANARFDGSVWQASIETDAIWAASPSSVYAVQQFGAIEHFDGASWTRMPAPTYSPFGGTALQAVSGTSTGDVYAGGVQGTILHYDGTSWTSMTSGTTESVYSLYAASPTVAFAGIGDAILRYDGTSWSTSTATASYVSSLSGSGPSDVYAAIGQNSVLHFDGTNWTSTGFVGEVDYLWERGPADLYAVGTTGGLYHYDGSWTAIPGAPTSDGVLGLGGDATDVVASYQSGLIVRWDGSAWHTMLVAASGLTDTWTTPSGYTYAAAGGGVLQVYGSTTTVLQTGMPTVAMGGGVPSVWASGPNDIWLVGGAGAIVTQPVALHFDGTGWTQYTLGPNGWGLTAVWGAGTNDVYAGGIHGIFHWDGSAWTSVTGANITALWGSGSSDVFGVGANGTIVHYDGTSWSAMTSGVTASIVDIWGNGANDVFAATTTGVLHYDGIAWSPVKTRTPAGMTSVWGLGGNYFFGDALGNTWRLMGRLPR